MEFLGAGFHSIARVHMIPMKQQAEASLQYFWTVSTACHTTLGRMLLEHKTMEPETALVDVAGKQTDQSMGAECPAHCPVVKKVLRTKAESLLMDDRSAALAKLCCHWVSQMMQRTYGLGFFEARRNGSSLWPSSCCRWESAHFEVLKQLRPRAVRRDRTCPVLLLPKQAHLCPAGMR
jgi:hypothetical protein